MPKKITKEEYNLYFKENYPDYELLSDYKGDKIKIKVKCKLDGHIWEVKPNRLKRGVRCQQCYRRKQSKILSKTTEQFILESKDVHGNKYDYTKVKYENNKTKVCIICPLHGEFYITPNKHINSKQGCDKCADMLNGIKKRLTTEEFIKRACIIHGDKYDYTKVKYVRTSDKVIIKCPKHGEFEQTPSSHIQGAGCPKCKESKLERDIHKLLKDNNINFISQKRFKWLGAQSLDFYLPDYNIAIECQGLQHFKNSLYNTFDYDLSHIIKRDTTKYELCYNNNIKIIYFANTKDIFNISLYNKDNTFLSKKSLLEHLNIL